MQLCKILWRQSVYDVTAPRNPPAHSVSADESCPLLLSTDSPKRQHIHTNSLFLHYSVSFTQNDTYLCSLFSVTVDFGSRLKHKHTNTSFTCLSSDKDAMVLDYTFSWCAWMCVCLANLFAASTITFPTGFFPLFLPAGHNHPLKYQKRKSLGQCVA